MKILVLSLLIAALALGTGQALAAGSHQQSHLKTLNVVMHDPGCHWFLVHGRDTKKATVAGPIRLKNLDEATLKLASHTKDRLIPVGKSIVVRHGKYIVMMVGQAVDDNYLKLTVK
jgi:hypothetical protein